MYTAKHTLKPDNKTSCDARKSDIARGQELSGTYTERLGWQILLGSLLYRMLYVDQELKQQIRQKKQPHSETLVTNSLFVIYLELICDYRSKLTILSHNIFQLAHPFGIAWNKLCFRLHSCLFLVVMHIKLGKHYISRLKVLSVSD